MGEEMGATNHLDWQATQDAEYIRTSVARLGEPPLKWCVQFSKILESDGESLARPLTINDIGCNVGHFFRSIQTTPHANGYVGYDISKTYLDVAKEAFPDAMFMLHDIVASAPLRAADVSVVSATLEHCDDWRAALGNIFRSTTHKVYLRTFAERSDSSALYYKATAKLPYVIREFSFRQLYEEAEIAGFSVQTVRDQATDSIPRYLGCGITRTQYVFIFQRKGA